MVLQEQTVLPPFFPSSTCPAIALCDGGTPPLFPPCHGVAQRAKTENLFLAFIFLRCKKINAFQALKSLLNKSYSHSFYLPTRVGNRAKL